MNLEQVKEHFKYAKEVRCAYDSNDIYLIKPDEIVKSKSNDDFAFKKADKDFCIMYNSATNQLAEILTYIFDRGEEVEISDNGENWYPIQSKHKFLTFTLDGLPVVQTPNGNVSTYNHIRKLTPESRLEPQLTELKNKAKEINCTITIIFEGK